MILTGLVHIAVSALVAQILGGLMGGLNSVTVVLSLLAGGVAAWPARSLFRDRPEELRWQGWAWLENALVVFLLLIGFRQFAYLFYYSENTYRTLSANNLGDLPLHINYIRQLSQGGDMLPMNPEFASERLSYPYGLDLYNALWEALGVPLSSHLFLTGLFLMFATIVALRAWAGWLGIGGFFLNGGWAGWQVFSQGEIVDYQHSLAWKNFFLSLFITQRGLMFAVPVGLILLMVTRGILSGRRTLQKREMLLLGLLWGSLGFFHLHSFFAISLIIAFYFVLYRQWKPLRWLMLPAVPIGSFFVFYSTGFFQKAGIAHLKWGWTAGEQNLAAFWWINLGPWLLLFLMAGAWLLVQSVRSSRSRPEIRTDAVEYAIYLGLFAVFTVVMLAPWDWDNIKVLIWPYFGLLAVTSRVFFGKSAAMPWPNGFRFVGLPERTGQAIAVGLAVILFLSGMVSVLGASKGGLPGTVIYQARDLWNMEGALENVPIDAVLLAAPSHDHPLTYWGRKRVLGYEGHLWSHGIDYTDVKQKQERIFQGDAAWLDLAKELGATHILWTPTEQAVYPDTSLEAGVEGLSVPSSGQLWKQKLENVSDVENYEVYEIR